MDKFVETPEGINVNIKLSDVVVKGIVMPVGTVTAPSDCEMIVRPVEFVVVTAEETSVRDPVAGLNVICEPLLLVIGTGVEFAVGIVNISPELDMSVMPSLFVVVNTDRGGLSLTPEAEGMNVTF